MFLPLMDSKAGSVCEKKVENNDEVKNNEKV